MDQDIYSEYILEHARHPHNKKVMDPYTVRTTLQNEGCADELTAYLYIKNNTVQEATFSGVGCAISTAAASLFSTHIQGKTVTVLQAMVPGEVYTLLGVTIHPMRSRCALLMYEAVQKALLQYARN